MEEAHLKQKSRIQWLKLGDSKTGFFHKARQSKNRLLSVYNAEGEKLEDHKAVSQEAVSFFQLGGDPTLERELVAEIIGIFYFTFYQEDRCLLSLPVEAEKIKRTMFSLNSPGPRWVFCPLLQKCLGDCESGCNRSHKKYFFASGKLRLLNQRRSERPTTRAK